MTDKKTNGTLTKKKDADPIGITNQDMASLDHIFKFARANQIENESQLLQIIEFRRIFLEKIKKLNKMASKDKK